jgi:hypothetical protein
LKRLLRRLLCALGVHLRQSRWRIACVPNHRLGPVVRVRACRDCRRNLELSEDFPKGPSSGSVQE